MKKAGTWWFWYYKDALKTNENVPEFKVEGRKSLLGYLFGTRQQLTNETLKSNTTNQQQKAYCFIFFPKADHSTDQFTSSLIQNFKTSVTLSKNQKNIHLFITCNNIEQFDNLTKNIPSGINIWADINGEIATKFGMRPLLLEVNLQSLFSEDTNSNNNKNKYSKQTINGMFFILQNKIIKSPAYQPKLQTISIDTMKSIYDSIEKSNFNFEKIISKDAYAADLTESEIQNLYPNAWKEYEMEMNQMNKDLNNNLNNKNITNKVKKSVVTKNSGVAALPLTTTTIKKKTNTTTTPTTTVKKKVTKTGGTNATNKVLSSKKKISSNNNTKINKQRYSKL
ncbi:hypothetical protein ABK040_007616 [Willaertia magna]